MSQLVVIPAFLSYSILGLFNVCDKILVAIDILLEWRELFKRGCPISSFIEAKSEQLLLKVNKVISSFLNRKAVWSCPFLFRIYNALNNLFQAQCTLPTSEKLGYYNKLLYNGFWAFEMLTERDLSNTVCGICGVIGEVYLGDGNEKNCCSNSKVF